jgi:ADP-heptose:LPS heptosyltransferase
VAHDTHWSPWLGKEPAIHECEWYSNVVEAPKRKLWPLGFERENRALLSKSGECPKSGLPSLKEPNRDTVSELTSNNRLLGKVQFGQYVLVNPTASRIEKAWPAAKFRELCLALKPMLQQLGKRIVVVGAPNETEWLYLVAGRDFHVVQPQSLGELIDVVAGSSLLVTNTSSVQYIAAGTKTQTITLMGRALPLRWGPVGPSDRVIRGTIPANASDIFEEEQLGYESITVDSVLSEVLEAAKISHPQSNIENPSRP